MKKLSSLALIMLILVVATAAPAQSPLAPPKHGGVYVIAHRGVHQDIPENTLPAYARAIELGADFVEIDVRTTKDGKFVSVHNETLESYIPGATTPIKDMTLEEIRAFDVGAPKGPEWAGTRVPTFQEILDLCQGKIGIYLDLKDAPVAPLVEEIRKRKMERQVLWYAFPKFQHEVQQLCPDCIPMPDPLWEDNLPKTLEEFKPKVVATSWGDYSKAFVETCHKAGALVFADDDGPASWQPALDFGTDGIQTDEVSELIKFLKDRTRDSK